MKTETVLFAPWLPIGLLVAQKPEDAEASLGQDREDQQQPGHGHDEGGHRPVEAAEPPEFSAQQCERVDLGCRHRKRFSRGRATPFADGSRPWVAG